MAKKAQGFGFVGFRVQISTKLRVSKVRGPGVSGCEISAIKPCACLLQASPRSRGLGFRV